MKKIFTLIMVIIMSLTISGCEKKDTKNSANESSSKTSANIKGFHIDGTKLLDGNGNKFVMRGVNLAHSWYKEDTPVCLKAIAKTGSNAVRIVLSDGRRWYKDELESVKEIIKQCKELKMIAILEVHDPTGYDYQSHLDTAIDYWIEIKDALIGQEDYVIVNIANEWYGQWDVDPWFEGYLNVIPKLREAGIKNTFMIDAAGWGQYPQSIIQSGKSLFEVDPLKNTMFSVHFYGSAGGYADKIQSTLESIREQGLCVCTGEFGYTHSDGDVDEDFIMQYCTEQDIGYLGWSWIGNSGGVEYLDIALDNEGKKLSPEWGEKLINGEYGIKKTSKICSIFEN